MTYTKTIKLGTVPGEPYGYKARMPVEIEVWIRDRELGPELAIQGIIWKPHRGDMIEGGQCQDTIAELFEDTPLAPKVQRIVEVWKRWHLNGMRAGCEHQRAAGWSSQMIGKSCPVCTYRYGSAWLTEPLPEEIIAEVKSW